MEDADQDSARAELAAIRPDREPSCRTEVDRAGRGRAILVGLAGPIVWLLFVAVALDMGPLAQGRHPISLPMRIPLAIFALLGVASLPLWRRWVRSSRGWLRFAILGLARTAFYVALLVLALLVEALASAAGGEDLGRRCAQLFVEASSGLRFALQNVGILVAILALGFGDLAWIRSLEAPRAAPLRRRPRTVTSISTARHLRALLVALLSGGAWSIVFSFAWLLLFDLHRPGWSLSLEVDPCVLLSCGLASVITWEALSRYGTPRASLGSAVRWGIVAQVARWMLWLPIDVIVFLAVEKQTISPLDALQLAGGWKFLMFDLVATLVLRPYQFFAFLALLLPLGALEMVLFRHCFRAREERSAAPP